MAAMQGEEDPFVPQHDKWANVISPSKAQDLLPSVTKLKFIQAPETNTGAFLRSIISS